MKRIEVAATILNETALYHKARAAWAEAEPLFQRALTIREKALGPEHPDLAISLNDLAALYQDISRFAEAEPLFQRALTIREKILDPEHPTLPSRSTTWPSSTGPPAALPRPSRSTSAP